MLCPSCEFHNMPGSSLCARCGASLKLATAEIDVNPPRAGRWERRMPGLAGGRRGWNHLRSLLTAELRSLLVPRTVIEHAPRWWSLLVPGLPQIQRGERRRGRVLLVVYLGLMAAGLVTCGTGLGSMLLGLAFAAHVAAIADAFGARSQTFGDSLRLTVMTMFVLATLVYMPTGWAISRVATPLRITGVMPPFQEGDVVWYNRSSTPEVGDLVVYDLPQASVAGRTEGGQAMRVQIQGDRINRVVAVAGQRVEWAEQQLVVDGQVSPWQPAASLTTFRQITVPEGSLFILPDHLVPMSLPNMPWTRLSVVSHERVGGRVFFRSLPWNRISLID